jgi:hypothetical protein
MLDFPPNAEESPQEALGRWSQLTSKLRTPSMPPYQPLLFKTKGVVFRHLCYPGVPPLPNWGLLYSESWQTWALGTMGEVSPSKGVPRQR